ncbi:retrovirus-related Pol polyprotein from transposon TNT 1-94 [Trichonephila clavata]|uniref:Retrovirus-related Pol polyprotein from transposon TNT 1-94 n=1 Tax=Trichonephila clavata TaxID=2740835 RepID=A0A8X6H3B3_TRICU|nr:retrovirus-related Pol polyprotein from transposon TNT 1-94 [Trichonephila clavata]
METMLVESIVALTSNNYHTWKQDITAILIDHDCWDIIKGTEQPPSKESSNNEKLDSDTRKNRVFSTIYLNIAEVLRPLISNTTDGKEAWDILHKYFLPDSRARLIGLLDTFFSCRIQEGEGIEPFAARLQKIINDLLDCDEKISEKYKVFQLIRYLPTQFQPIVQSIYRWEDSKFTFDRVLEELIEEESRLLQCNRGSDLVAINSIVREVQKQSSHTKEEANPVKCHKCGKIGHLEINCRSEGENSRKKNPQRVKTLRSKARKSKKDSKKNCWIIDSGATTHCCGKREMFETLKSAERTHVFLANSSKCPVEGEGTIRLRFGSNNVLLKDVVYCSQIRHNLLSGSKLGKDGYTFVGNRGAIVVFNENRCKIVTANLYNGSYRCYAKNIIRKAPMEKLPETTTKEGDAKELHEKMGHINVQYISDSFDVVKGLPKLNANQFDCEPCSLVRAKRISIKPLGKIISTKPLQLIHTDICGPFRKQTEEGYRYFITFIDDMSRKVVCLLFKHKNEAVAEFQKFRASAEKFTGNKILAVRCDNGGNFRGSGFKRHRSEDVKNRESPAKSPRPQNFRKSRVPKTSDESTSSSSTYYSFSDEESASSELEIEPINQDSIVSDQKSEESYLGQTEKISEDSEDEDVDYSAVSCNGRNRTDIYF